MRINKKLSTHLEGQGFRHKPLKCRLRITLEDLHQSHSHLTYPRMEAAMMILALSYLKEAALSLREDYLGAIQEDR